MLSWSNILAFSPHLISAETLQLTDGSLQMAWNTETPVRPAGICSLWLKTDLPQKKERKKIVFLVLDVIHEKTELS